MRGPETDEEKDDGAKRVEGTSFCGFMRCWVCIFLWLRFSCVVFSYGQYHILLVYFCPQCKANTTTLPRYNKASKLLTTRKGRCGEYSNLFGLVCRAVGFETRLVLDLSDHLWTEMRLGDSWIMADACEGIIDKPSMYEYGWGKGGLSYMIGIGHGRRDTSIHTKVHDRRVSNSTT